MSQKLSVDVESFSARLNNLILPMGLRVATVDVSGNGIHLQKEPFVFQLSEPGQFRAAVAQEDLAAYLEKLGPAGLKSFKVQAKEDKLFIDAVKPVLFDVPAKAVCRLRIEDASRLIVVLESVEVLGAGMTNLVQSQLDRINPILDVADFPVNASLASVSASNGKVELIGSIAPR